MEEGRPKKQRWSGAYVALMSRLRGNWPIEESRFDAALQNFHFLWEEIGEKRFTRATEGIISDSPYQYFPSIAEFRSYIPAEGRKFCGNCDNGFIDGGTDSRGNRQLKFCDCTGGKDRARRVFKGSMNEREGAA